MNVGRKKIHNVLERLQSLQTEVNSIVATDLTLADLVTHKVDTLCQDIDAIRSGDYSTSDLREIALLAENLYNQKDLVEVQSLSWAVSKVPSIWSPQSLGGQLCQLASRAASRGVKVGHVFLVEECLQFAGDADEFSLARKLVVGGVAVVLLEPRRVKGERPSDFSIFSQSGGKRIALYADTQRSPSDSPLVRLLVPRAKVQKTHRVWEELPLTEHGVQLVEA